MTFSRNPIDDWTNVRRDAIINIVAMTLKAVFLKSTGTKGASEDADCMFETIEELITQGNGKKINTPISDNEPNTSQEQSFFPVALKKPFL